MGDSIVRTQNGLVKGKEIGDCRIFRGIPYAETKRFELPKPIAPWEGVFDATGEEIDCWQYSSFNDESKDEGNFYYDEFRSGRDFTYAESPMTLSIITPPNAENCPVLVFIHGGGHETGTVGELPYGTSTEYAKRGVILVTVGYRLNVFSLFRSRNYGLYDLIAALKWVKANIAGFGGDPERITMMGQSAGAMSVMDLCYSDLLKGIVKGAVMMSGAGLVPTIAAPWTPEQSKDFWDTVLRRAGVSTEEEAKMLPADKLWHAWYQTARAKHNFHAIQPGIDGTVIPDLPQRLRRSGKILNIPMIMGVTSQDMIPYMIYEMAYHFGVWSFLHKRQPVYGYMFDRTPPGNRYKAFHGADLWYMFGNMDQSWRPFEKVDYELSAQMIDYVVQFVKTGNPNREGLPPWEPMSQKSRAFRLFDGVSDGTISPMECRRKMNQAVFREKGPL